MNEQFPLVIGILFLSFLILRELKKYSCPRCKKIIGQEVIEVKNINAQKQMIHRRCNKCGNEYEIEKSVHQEGFVGGDGGGGE